ncbi:MAG TPA: ABC transporter ATP-binding protein [Rhodopila sp.]|uniref:ABC transporter ATP-binding protein n=1 Tax=Rhodopila sp. TaxID=2480087 RepID=UPI002BAAC889|nr:ABC transporter ATP-binding protein [Rhodopila sp.]HVY16353.1 ABC transporter ATP-binding protein [Rhodopila sp.]
MTELRVEGLGKRFGGLRVFQDLSFTLPAGGLLGVIGPNGAGKTTLINVVTGRQAASAGKVLLDGRDITNQPAYAVSRLGLARSFQQTNTFKSVSVAENIARAVRFGGRGTPDGLNGLLDAFGLAPRLPEIADKLPYGLQKMLGLVMAFAAGPKVLLLDEPAAGLERTERQHVDTFVGHVRASGTSVLIVEHDMDMIRRLCPRILVLDAGVLLADGPPAEVLARPDVIAAYLGDTEEAG